jgi:oligopeptide transport system substrate-binding protein
MAFKKNVPVLVLALLAVIAVGVVVYNNSKTQIKSLVMAISSDLDSFDPAKVFNDDGLFALSNVYEPLYQYHYLKRPFEIEPLIAEGKPQVLEQGKKWVVKIKSGIFYHAHPAIGAHREVIAQDFINQIKRIAWLPLKSPGRWIFMGKLVGFEDFSLNVGDDLSLFLNSSIRGARVIDKYTFELELLQPDMNFINFLAMSFFVPIPEELIIHTKNNLDNTLIGTGPFELFSYVPGVELIFNRFKNYRKELYPSVGDRYANTENLLEASKQQIPFIEKLTIFILKESDEMWERFLDGDIDFINVPKSHTKHLFESDGKIKNNLKSKNVELKHFSSLSSRWIGFNMRDKTIGENVNLRKAIAFAIEYEEYIAKLMNNSNMRANSIFLAGIPGYNPTNKLPYEFNLDRARYFLVKAGFPDGKGAPELVYSTRNSSEVAIEEGKFIKRCLERIGLKVKIDILEFADFLRKGRNGELQMWTDQWIYDYPDPENLVQLLLTKNHPGINKSGYSNKQIDQLYGRMIAVTDLDEKQRIMAQIEEIIHQEMPWVMLTFESAYILHYSRLKNLRKSSFIRNFVKYLDVK